MSRIQQILSRAEKDGTTAGLTWADTERRADDRGAATPGWSGAPVDGTPVVPDTEPAGTVLGGRPVFGVKLNKLLVAVGEPFSGAAEQYRSLRTRIAQLDAQTPRPVFAVTSPGRGDGKSVTVLNLALSMAQEFDRRTLLIDADLRNARLHTLLGIAREPGLVDVLNGTVSIEEALVTLPGYRLQVLPAGSIHTHPAELLGSAAMRRVMEAFRRYFDRVLLDAAPAQSADTGALEPCLDGTVMVVRAGKTARASIERALGAIPAPKLMGLVLNDSRNTDGLTGA